jgi:hypothetical protein
MPASYSKPPTGSGGGRKKKPIPGAARAVEAEAKKQLNYTPSPTVRGSKPGKSGGVWTDKQGRAVATSKAEDTKMKRVRGGRGSSAKRI